MQIPCPSSRTNVYSVKQKYWASAFSPLKCTHCGAMAAPSWWTALALLPVPLLPIFGLWFSLTYSSWWPVSLAFVGAIAVHHLVTRYFPLGRISRGEVLAFRVGGVVLAAFLVVSVALAVSGYRVAL